jgi:Haemolysin XhlA
VKGVGADRKEKAIGIVITPRELYDLVQQATLMLQRIESRLDVLEEKLEDTHETDERSRQALTLAKEARDTANDAKQQIEWLWRTLIGALITGAVGAFFYFAQNGG